MTAGTIVAIIVVVIVVAALIAFASLGARRRRLRERFGPEYDRAVENSDSKLKAESQLAERERRVRHLDIRPLDLAARDSYARQWTGIQEQFVDDPVHAVTVAQTLITSVMNDRGYPTQDEAQIIADLSVEHASTIENYRTAQDFSSRAASGTASTEDLRQAMVHYRILFQDLLGDPAEAVAAQDAAGGPVVNGSADEDYRDGGYGDRGYVSGTAPADPAGTPEGRSREAEPIIAQPTVADPTVIAPEDKPELVFPDPGPRDAQELRAASRDQASTTPASTEPATTGPANTAPASTGRTDTVQIDAVPADDPTAASHSADIPASEAQQDDETSAAASGRLPRRR
jgi:hypothetical protein